jgi:hypothetical protein
MHCIPYVCIWNAHSAHMFSQPRYVFPTPLCFPNPAMFSQPRYVFPTPLCFPNPAMFSQPRYVFPTPLCFPNPAMFSQPSYVFPTQLCFPNPAMFSQPREMKPHRCMNYLNLLYLHIRLIHTIFLKRSICTSDLYILSALASRRCFS